MKSPMFLLETIRAFMKSRILLTAAELDLFTQIDRGIDSAERLAEENQTDIRALTRLLDAIVTFGLLTKQGRRYLLTEDAAGLCADRPESVLPMILHMNDLWNTWSHLTATVRRGENPERIPVSEKEEKSLSAFIGAMHVIGQTLAREISGALDLSRFHKLLDIGGGSGTYTLAFLQRNPEMTAVIFDLPEVLPMAEKRLADAGISDRVTLVPGNFDTDRLPEGCDLALLSAIIHQNSPVGNAALFGKIHAALPPGGTLIIRDHIMDDDRTSPPDGAVFALNMLVATDGGDTYTFSEVRDALEAAGFSDIRQIRHGERMDCLVTAKK